MRCSTGQAQAGGLPLGRSAIYACERRSYIGQFGTTRPGQAGMSAKM
jgi:hypothetical protein